jgi:pimeloyl-ACP methyl ester carboxylesterase
MSAAISTSAWRARGATFSIESLAFDHEIFVVDGGLADGTPLLLLHGFPTSSWDFAPVFDALAAERRVVTFDMLGYGFSSKPKGFSYSLIEQADVAIEVMKRAKISRAHVWAHDMGTSVATELCARAERGTLPFELASLVLSNGSVHIELAHLTLGQKVLKSSLGPLFARLNSGRTFKAQLKRVFAKPPSDDDLESMWQLASREDGTLRFPQIIRYTEERWRFERRWIGALERLTVPTLIAWGERDPVAVLAIAERLAREIPRARKETWPDLGHYPHVEAPARVLATLQPFLREHDVRARRA